MSTPLSFLSVTTLCLCLGKVFSQSSFPPTVQVVTEEGTLEGYLRDTESGEGHSAYVFLGVPFAQSTSVSGLFYAPQRNTAWRGVKKADEPAKSCYGTVDNSYPGFRGSERWNPQTEFSLDCLALNLFLPPSAPSTPPHRRLPVLVWIYGGGFTSGSASLDLYDGKVLASKGEVIVVTLNYRLGAFGFLAFDFAFQPMLTGNVGLQDQEMALDWIQRNIASFGGDPEKVTIFGESAGAVSVSYHTVRNQRLFKGAVMQSGTLLCPWATERRHLVSQRSKFLAESLGCFDRMKPQRNSSAIIACMNKHRPKKIMKHAGKANKKLKTFQTAFAPVREESEANPGDFPRDLFDNKTADGPLMMGWNRDEGSFLLPYYFPRYFPLDYKLPRHGPHNYSISYEEYYRTVEKIVEAYYTNSSYIYNIAMHYLKTPGSGQTREYHEAVIALAGDLHLSCPIQTTIDILRAQGRTVFQFYFTHDSDGNPWPKWMGVLHGEEIPMVLFFNGLKWNGSTTESFQVFGVPFKTNQQQHYNWKDRQVSAEIMEMWSNFAKKGNPSTKSFVWPAHLTVELSSDGPRVINQVPHFCDYFRSLDNFDVCQKNPYFWACDHKTSIKAEAEEASPPPTPTHAVSTAPSATTTATIATTAATTTTTKATTTTSPVPSSEVVKNVKAELEATPEDSTPVTEPILSPSPTSVSKKLVKDKPVSSSKSVLSSAAVLPAIFSVLFVSVANLCL